jgi:hypothetical protein
VLTETYQFALLRIHKAAERSSFGDKTFDCLYCREGQLGCFVVGMKWVRLSVGGLVAHKAKVKVAGLHGLPKPLADSIALASRRTVPVNSYPESKAKARRAPVITGVGTKKPRRGGTGAQG